MIDRSKYDADGKLKNGVFKERYKDGAVACVGTKGKLVKTARHKSET